MKDPTWVSDVVPCVHSDASGYITISTLGGPPPQNLRAHFLFVTCGTNISCDAWVMSNDLDMTEFHTFGGGGYGFYDGEYLFPSTGNCSPAGGVDSFLGQMSFHGWTQGGMYVSAAGPFPSDH